MVEVICPICKLHFTTPDWLPANRVHDMLACAARQLRKD